MKRGEVGESNSQMIDREEPFDKVPFDKKPKRRSCVGICLEECARQREPQVQNL